MDGGQVRPGRGAGLAAAGAAAGPEALEDPGARLATEAELQLDFPGYELGALPPLGSLLGVPLLVDPEVLDHELVVFAAGTETESVRVVTGEMFRDEPLAVLPLTRPDGRASEDPIPSAP